MNAPDAADGLPPFSRPYEFEPEEMVHLRFFVGDDRIIDIRPMHVGMVTLSIGPKGSSYYTDSWDFETTVQAVTAAEVWDATPGTEPYGWYRHAATGRRRPGGLPSQEYINK